MGGFNDQLAIGTSEAMKIYSDTFFNLNKFAHELGRWHPETFLGKQLNDNNSAKNKSFKLLCWGVNILLRCVV